MAWPLVVGLLLTAWVGSNFYRLFTNYLIARKTGFPLVICPLNPHNVLWIIIGAPLRGTLKRYLPAFIFHRANLTIYGYEYFEKNGMHERYGRNFILVTFDKNELNVGDPELATDILKRPREFTQSLIGSQVMRLFGDNLITSNGEHWARQRKIIASNINERISSTVFQASRQQTLEMMDSLVPDNDNDNNNNAKGVTNTYTEGLKTIAINVLGKAGYGVYRPWKDLDQTPGPGYKFTYMAATRLAVDHIVEAVFIPRKLLLLPFMPQILQDVGQAANEFPMHTKDMLDSERKKPSEHVNLMSMLVKESDAATAEAEKTATATTTTTTTTTTTGSAGLGLSEEEIMGNLFVFTAAGFDTTANTMGYCMTLLAAYPEWQDWLFHELDQVLAGKNGGELDYADVFPKLSRCLALMLETMRLFTPVLHIARQADPNLPSPAAVTSGGKTCHIPPDTVIYVNSAGIHTNTSIWGPDALDFRPSRWIVDSPSGPSVKTMPKGTYLAWSAGPRNCPGYKMSQVEFVSVFATIFQRYRVDLVLNEGESKAEGRKRVEGAMEDSQSRLTLQMNRPETVSVRFVSR